MTIAVCALLALALCVSACSEGDSAATGKQSGVKASGKTAAGSPTARCGRQLRRFVGALDALRDAIVVGVTYDSYLAEVRDLQRSYGRVPVDKLAVGCLLGVGAPAERALNTYVKAANTWGNCLAETTCRIESIESKLRRGWEGASALLSEAQAGRRAM